MIFGYPEKAEKNQWNFCGKVSGRFSNFFQLVKFKLYLKKVKISKSKNFLHSKIRKFSIKNKLFAEISPFLANFSTQTIFFAESYNHKILSDSENLSLPGNKV